MVGRKNKRKKMLACPHCGHDFPAGRLSCPECGSDAETGWKSPEEIDYQSVELPELDEDKAHGPEWAVEFGRIILVILIISIFLWLIWF